MLNANNLIVSEKDTNENTTEEKYPHTPVITLELSTSDDSKNKASFSINNEAYNFLKLDVPEDNNYIIFARKYITVIEEDKIINPLVVGLSKEKLNLDTIDKRVSSSKIHKKSGSFYSIRLSVVVLNYMKEELDIDIKSEMFSDNNPIESIDLELIDNIGEENVYSLKLLSINYVHDTEKVTDSEQPILDTEEVTQEELSSPSSDIDSVDSQNITPEIIDNKGIIVQ